MKELQAGDIHIAYNREGHGFPLVLLHGGMDDSRSWRLQMEELSDEFTVLAWDAPGCGRSSDIPESWRMPDYANAIALWLNSIGIERAHILGLSWGSSIALEFFRLHQHIPRSLILASAYAGWAGSLSSEEVDIRLKNVLAYGELSPEETAKAFPGMFGQGTPQELVDEMVAIWSDNSPIRKPGGYKASVHSMAEADLRNVLPLVRIPTLLIHGELDERSPLQVVMDIKAGIVLSQLSVIKGAGHMVNIEAPREFNSIVRTFLRSVENRT